MILVGFAARRRYNHIVALPVIRLTGNQVVGYQESGYQVSGSKNRTIHRNTCRKNVEIEMKFWYSGP
jgi:hypothetical protein